MTENFVLIVDDDEDARLLITEIARIAGYASATAQNFVEAKALLDKRPSAVLLDMIMPDQLCIRIAAYMADEMPKTPIVLMSASDEATRKRMAHNMSALGLRVAATLHKPFWVDGLLEAMAEALPNESASIGIEDSRGVDE
jgi:CheY-like chemotaxis protein